MVRRRPGHPRESSDREDKKRKSLRDSLILLGRDIAVALLVVLIVFGIIFLYTQNWPPEVVVESRSMQHSDTESSIGVIDTGDIVLVQVAPAKANVVTWVEGRAIGHSTYSDFGDVIVYRPPTNPGDTPWIHRVILYLEWNITSNGYDVPSLLGLPRADWAARDAGGSDLEFPYAITGSVYLKHLGFRGDLGITFNLGELITQGYRQDGYITMGDYNSDRDCSAVRDPCPARPYDRWVVPHANVIGKARGELPSFGLIKLLVAPTPSCCRSWGDPSAPKNSWDALAVSIVLLIAAPFLIDYGWTFGTKRWKSWRARREEEPAEVGDSLGLDDEPEEPPPPDEYEGPI